MISKTLSWKFYQTHGSKYITFMLRWRYYRSEIVDYSVQIKSSCVNRKQWFCNIFNTHHPAVHTAESKKLYHYLIKRIHATKFAFYRCNWNRKCFFVMFRALCLHFTRLLVFDKLPRINHRTTWKKPRKCLAREKIKRETTNNPAIFTYFMSKHNLLWLWRFGWL